MTEKCFMHYCIFLKKINNSEPSILSLKGYLEIWLLLADLMSAPVRKTHLIFGDEARAHNITCYYNARIGKVGYLNFQ